MPNEIRQALKDFIGVVNTQRATDHASETSYYPAIQQLFQTCGNILAQKGENITAQIESNGDSNRIPDVTIFRGLSKVGYAEIKHPKIDIENIENGANSNYSDFNSKQFNDYRSVLDNLIYTNCLEWRLYRRNEPNVIQLVKIARLDGNTVRLDSDAIKKFEALLVQFFSASPQSIGTTESLAKEMAKLTRVLRNRIEDVYDSGDTYLKSLFYAFKNELVHDLKAKDFADMYAQTIAYGLFTARNIKPNEPDFDRISAVRYLPKTNPFLRSVFKSITDEDNIDKFPASAILIIDELATLIKAADMSAIHRQLNDYEMKRKEGNIIYGDKDPIIYFYEPFLAEYDPKKREARGVYYTPLPVVSYIVRSIDEILQKEFGIEKGLADENVVILDPACGSGTFLYEVVNVIYEKMGKRSIADWKSKHVPNLLKRLYGFELMMAPYTIAHLKLAKQLQDTGYEFGTDQRLNIFLTNTLEKGEKIEETLGLSGTIAHESNEAARVKNTEKVMVILGNPPYSNYSQNKSDWILELIKVYKPKGEKKLNLDDDYIKFLRFAHWKISQTSQGVIGMITNSSFLNGITHREMRAKLLNDFTDARILNLFGRQNTFGDENVFDINSIGVSISLLVKNKTANQGLISYSSSYGKREDKFKTLFDSNCYSIDKNEINPVTLDDELSKTRWGKKFPYFKFFTPMQDKNVELIKDYGDFWGLYQIFKVLNSAIETDRDETVVDLDSDTLKKRMKKAFTGNYDADFIKKYKIHNSSSYKFKDKLKTMSYDDKGVQTCQYRPFDFRYLYYIKGFTSRHGFDTMQHFFYNTNLGLSVSRQVINDNWAHIFITNTLTERCLVSTESKECTYVAPLYLYNETTNGFWPEITDRKPNFTKEFNEFISHKYSEKPTPEQILGYIYAVLYSQSYREMYLELLKIDFPRIPFPKDYDSFNQLADLGKELVDLHTMNKKDYGDYKQMDGNSPALVGNIFYDKNNQEIILDSKKPKNEQIRIGKVPQHIWDFQIGGYQVIKTWLIGTNKTGYNLGRKGQIIEIGELCQILNALTETDRIMKAIDPIFKQMMGI